MRTFSTVLVDSSDLTTINARLKYYLRAEDDDALGASYDLIVDEIKRLIDVAYRLGMRDRKAGEQAP